MTIRKAETEDLPYIYGIYEKARLFMRAHSNPCQWGSSYPEKELTEEDIREKRLFVITENDEKREERIEGVFVFTTEEEKNYREIDGSWSYTLPCGVIHRVASSGRIKNITRSIFNYCLTIIDYLRIDTHEDNTTMQNALARYGFRRCGIIYYNRDNSATKRIAYDYKA